MDNLKTTFDAAGVLVCRGLIQPEVAAGWRMQYDALHNPNRVPEYNPVSVNDERLQPLLSLIATHPAILGVVEQLFGPDIALYNQRFVVKDKHARGAVFLHQDTPYHCGWPTKLSAFVALSKVEDTNGAMIFYPGTHKYGYLGDAGELSEVNSSSWTCPFLNQGDFVLMHSAMWHKSFHNRHGLDDRILADIIYQPADDPSGVELLRGEWRTPVRMSKEMRENLFVKSRTMAMRDMQGEIDRLWADLGGRND